MGKAKGLDDIFDDRGALFPFGMAAGFCLCTSVLITSIFLIGFSYRVVNYDQYGLLYNQISREILEDKAYTAGRYFVGLGKNFHRFNSTMRTIEFSRRAGAEDSARSQFDVRATDGQTITLELSFQYQLRKDELKQLYINYKHDYEKFYVRKAYSSLRDVAAEFESEQFFFSRDVVEARMLAELTVELARRHADVVGFQLREITLPSSLDDRLLDIELAKQIAREGEARINETKIEAETTKAVMELAAERNNLLVTLEQETELMRTQIERGGMKVLAETERNRTRIQVESTKALALYRQDTENRRLELAKNLTAVNIETTKQVRLIELQTDIDRARKDAQKGILRAQAEASRLSLVQQARADAQRAMATAEIDAFSQLASDLGLTPEQSLHLMWVEALGDHSGHRLVTDMYTPTAVFLPGQREAYMKKITV